MITASQIKISIIAMFVIMFVAVIFTSNAFAERTTTTWTQSGEGVTVTPYIWSGHDNFFFDFGSANFSNIEYVYYDLEYNTDESGTKRGVKGSFVPTITDPFGSYEGIPYYRIRIPLGTCSGKECVYHSNPRDVKMTVNTKMLTGSVDQYTQVLQFPNDQLSN